MINDHDARTLYDIANKKEKEKQLHNYQVTFHLLKGKDITVLCENESFDKQNFADNLCCCKYAILEGGNVCVNIQQVLYLEIKEIIND
jgi:hypothetical protein